MNNLTENRVNAQIPVADITAINTAINTITSKLPAVTLNEGQRATFSAIDINNKTFIQDVINELTTSGAGIVPGFINVAFLQNDLALYEQMDALEVGLANLIQKVSDIKRICGHESYSMALSVYHLYVAANQAGISGAKQGYDKLSERFAGMGAGRQADAGTL